MEAPEISYVNIFVSDFVTSLKFYRDRIGLTPKVEDSSFGYASFQTKGADFAFAQTDQSELIGRHTGIGWGVSDLDSTYADMVENGVEFESAPARQPWGGYMAIFRDPDNNLFYLDQLRQD